MSPLKNTKQEIKKEETKILSEYNTSLLWTLTFASSSAGSSAGISFAFGSSFCSSCFSSSVSAAFSWLSKKSLKESRSLFPLYCSVYDKRTRNKSYCNQCNNILNISWMYASNVLFFFLGPLNRTSSPQQNAVIKKSRMFFQASYQRHI